MEMPFGWKALKLGFLGDVFVGIGAAVAAILISKIFQLRAEDAKSSVEQAKQVVPPLDMHLICSWFGFGILGGIAGMRLLDKASTDFLALEHKVEKLVNQQKEISVALNKGFYHLAKKQYAMAVSRFKEALSYDAKLTDAKFGLALARSYHDPKEHAEPVKLLTELIIAEPEFPDAHYNRACVMALNLDEYSDAQIEADLKHAFERDASLKVFAKDDTDFKLVAEKPWFKSLTDPQRS